LNGFLPVSHSLRI